jgi:hypothetical protein
VGGAEVDHEGVGLMGYFSGRRHKIFLSTPLPYRILEPYPLYPLPLAKGKGKTFFLKRDFVPLKLPV